MDRGLTIIVGAGMAGLTCAKVLYEAGQACLVLEAEATVGGRVRSERREGFTLDRGFQVLFTRYPLVRRHLDLTRLAPRAFESGAIIVRGHRRTLLADPLRHPGHLARTALSPALTPLDKLRLAILAAEVGRRSLGDLWREPDRTTTAYLRQRGFSARFIENVARPLLGGIFLDPGLGVSARATLVACKMLLEGETVVPAAGMGAISQQLADCLPRERLRLATPVGVLLREEGRVVGVRTAAGEEVRGERVVVATAAPAAAALTGRPTPTGQVGEINVQFASPVSLIDARLPLLNASRQAFINDATQISTVAPEYAPAGQYLLTCTILGQPALDDDAIVARCRAELGLWFGGERAAAPRPLIVHRLPYCQFAQPPFFNDHLPANTTDTPGLLLAGDYTRASSIDGAMRSGEQAARLILGAGDE